MNSSYQKALQYAYKLLSYRGRSEKELSKRLSMKGYDTQLIEDIINKLKLSGFLDDSKLASSLKRHAKETKLLGFEGTKKFLMERGIPPDIIKGTITGLDETETAKKLIDKKIFAWEKLTATQSNIQLNEAALKKIYGLLNRKGFSYETIKKTTEGLRASLNEKR